MGPMDPIRERYRRLRLQTRLSLHVILLVAVLFALLIPTLLLIQEAAILGTARENGIRLVTIFAFSSVSALVADDFLGLRQLVNSLGREKDLRYAMILDLDGRALIHSRVNEIGSVYRDPLTLRALATTEPFFQETRSRHGEILYDFAAPVMVLNQRRAVARLGISIAEELRLIRRTRNTILGLGLVTLASGLVWAHFQVRRLTRPIQALSQGAQSVARGDLTHRIPRNRQDEVGDLADAFNRMAESLQVRFEVDRELSSTLNLQVVLSTLARHAQHLCGADLAFLAFRERDATHATLAAYTGAVGTAIRDWIIRPGLGHAGDVLLEGRTITLPRQAPAPDPDEARVLAEEGIHRLILVPIRLHQAYVGVLGIGWRHEGISEEGTEEMLLRLADQAAVALANAHAYREIELLNRSLEAKVTERTRDLSAANAALEASHQKLREFDRLKSDFVSNVSHELRTPLTAIRMAVDNLLDGVTGEITPALQRYLTRVKSNTDRLVRLINDLLDLSRIEAGRIELHPTAVSVGEIIREVVESLRPIASEKDLKLTTTPKGLTTLAYVDRDRLQQVLINLVGNAVKFTPAGGLVDVSARTVSPDVERADIPMTTIAGARGTSSAFVEVTVEDTGQGIPPEELGSIFDKFHQIRRAGQGKVQGTGLGLSITKSLIELQGGRIWAESEAGRGSRFIFLLPAADARVAELEQAGRNP